MCIDYLKRILGNSARPYKQDKVYQSTLTLLMYLKLKEIKDILFVHQGENGKWSNLKKNTEKQKQEINNAPH
jgi:hypothetical protein